MSFRHFHRLSAIAALGFLACTPPEPKTENSAGEPGTGAAAPADPIVGTRISDTAFEFPKLAVSEQQATNSADITDIPINIWVARGQSHSITGIRVTGHATEFVCAQASLALLEFLADAKTVSGFLSYGVGEMLPAPGHDGEFGAKAEVLVADLSKIGAKNEGFLFIHDVSGFADVGPPPRAIESGSARFAVQRNQSAARGPAFIPLRTWSSDGSPSPVEFTFTKADLRDGAEVVERFSKDSAWAPITELIERARDRVARIERLKDWRNRGQRLDDGIHSFYTKTEWRSPTPQELAFATDTMVGYTRKFDALSLLEIGKGAFSSPEVRREIRTTEREIARNRLCQIKLARGGSCEFFVSVDVKPSTTKKDESADALLKTLLQGVQSVPDSVFDNAVELQQSEIRNLQRMLEVKKQAPGVRIAQQRATALDGLLRGWPVPISDEGLARDVDLTQATVVPLVWQEAFQRYATRTGTDLREYGHVAGVQERANLFYHVRQDATGRYSVVPTYVVLGDYLEVWDADKRRITIEAPGANGFEPDMSSEVVQ